MPQSIASNDNFASFNKENTHRSKTGGLPRPNPPEENKVVCIHALPSQADQGFCGMRLWTVGPILKVSLGSMFGLITFVMFEWYGTHEWGLHQPDKHIQIKIYIYIHKAISLVRSMISMCVSYDFNWSPPKTLQIFSAAICLNQICWMIL